MNTLEYSGLEKSFADWGIGLDDSDLELRANGPDTFRVRIPVASITPDAAFAFESSVIVRAGRSASGGGGAFTGGTVEFTGKRILNPLRSSASDRSVTFDFQNWWYDAEHMVFEQYQKVWNSTTHALEDSYAMPNLALFSKIVDDGGGSYHVAPATNGEQAAEVLQFILDIYAADGMAAPFQIGTIDIAMNVVYFIEKPMNCADVLLKCMEIEPDASITTDYSTEPPTVNIRKLANRTAVTLPLWDGTNHQSLNITPRDDLAVRAVIFFFQFSNSADGNQYTTFTRQKYGPNGVDSASDPNSGLRVVKEVLDMQGVQTTSVKGNLDVEALGARAGTQAGKRAWWSSKRGGEATVLEDSRVRFSATIPDADYIYATTGGYDSNGTARVAGNYLTSYDVALFTNRIVGGAYAPWMLLNDGTPVQSLKVLILAKMKYVEYDVVATGDTEHVLPANEAASNTSTNGNVNRETKTGNEHCVNCELTNGVTADYWATSSVLDAEAVPSNLAQYIYEAFATRQFDSSFVRVGESASGIITMENKVNYSNGRAEWATMNAQIQGINKNLGRGTVSVETGVSKHLSSSQLMDYFRMFRFRRNWYNPATRATGLTSDSGGQVTMPEALGNANTTAGTKNESRRVTLAYETEGDATTTLKGSIDLDATKVKTVLAATTPTLVDATPAHNLEPREIAEYDAECNVQYRIYLCSGAYTKP